MVSAAAEQLATDGSYIVISTILQEAAWGPVQVPPDTPLSVSTLSGHGRTALRSGFDCGKVVVLSATIRCQPWRSVVALVQEESKRLRDRLVRKMEWVEEGEDAPYSRVEVSDVAAAQLPACSPWANAAILHSICRLCTATVHLRTLHNC
jgi:hypothetical protein